MERTDGRINAAADIPGGAPNEGVRIVTENSRTMKFDVSGFESEQRGSYARAACGWRRSTVRHRGTEFVDRVLHIMTDSNPVAPHRGNVFFVSIAGGIVVITQCPAEFKYMCQPA
ncbi:MAG: hypothetical protein OXF55_12205 [Caldilineaceae bacterium]|nr:hypothetical protein [Caldilineaceae bacterium]